MTVTLKVGDRIKDNDPRMQYTRVLTITHILPNGVQAVDSRGRPFLYLRRRIFTDGRARKSGFTLLPSEPTPTAESAPALVGEAS